MHKKFEGVDHGLQNPEHFGQYCHRPQPALDYRALNRNSLEQNKIGHWNQKQNAKYYAFIDKFKDKFSEKQSRRQLKVFKAMSNFIKTRNPNQCRSHHHKMTKNFQTIEEALEFLKAKNGQLQAKSKKYLQKLENIEFSMIQQGKIGSSQMKNSNQKHLKPKQEQIYTEKWVLTQFPKQNYEKLDKINDIAKLGTAATYQQQQPEQQYEDHHNYQFSQSLPNFPSTGLLSDMNYGYPTYDAQETYPLNYPKSRQQIVLECQDLFVRWLLKVNELIQIDN